MRIEDQGTRSSAGESVREKEERNKDIILKAATYAIEVVTERGSQNIAVDAASYLMEMAYEDIKLHRALTDRYLPKSCSSEVNVIIRKNNGASWYARQTDTVSQIGGAVSRAKETAKRTLFDLVLPGGMLLRNATMQDLRGAEDFFMTQGRTMVERGTFMRFVRETMEANKVAPHSKVSAVLTVKQLEEIDDRANMAIKEVFDD